MLDVVELFLIAMLAVLGLTQTMLIRAMAHRIRRLDRPILADVRFHEIPIGQRFAARGEFWRKHNECYAVNLSRDKDHLMAFDHNERILPDHDDESQDAEKIRSKA